MSRTGFIARLAVAAVLVLSVVPAPALAAVDAYLKLDGVRGESVAPGHTGQIEIYSWSMGATNTTAMHAAGGGGGAGKVRLHSFTITKTVDSASPSLFRSATTGQHYPRAVLYMRKAGGEQAPYVVYTFTDVTVVSVTRSSGGDRPQESITFGYEGMSVSSAPANDPSVRPTTAAPKTSLPPPKTMTSPTPH